MRRSFPFISVVIHAVVIAAALVGQTLADITLPTPRELLLFDASHIMPVDITLPAPPRRLSAARAEGPAVSRSAAPLVAPEGVTEETALEHASEPDATFVDGVPDGPPTATEHGGAAVVAVAPPAAPPAPIRLHSGVKAPRTTVHVAPVYPAIARAAHVEGAVILEAVLDASGRVESVRVLRSIPLLDQAAIDAVQQWRFTPALLNGEAVPVVMTITVNFTLQNR